MNTASWKTTLCGIIGVIAGTIATFDFGSHVTKIASCVATIASSLGLMFARDNNVTSEQAGAKSPASMAGKLPLLLLAIAPALFFTGCKSLEPSGAYQGDKITFEADTVIVNSYEVLRDFVRWEKNNRAALAPYPEIKKSADVIRLGAKKWISTAIAAREAYSLSPSPETRDNLTRSIAVLRAALSESVKYLNTHTP